MFKCYEGGTVLGPSRTTGRDRLISVSFVALSFYKQAKPSVLIGLPLPINRWICKFSKRSEQRIHR